MAFGLSPLQHAKELRKLRGMTVRTAFAVEREARAGRCGAALEEYEEAWRLRGQMWAHSHATGKKIEFDRPRVFVSARNAMERYCLRRR